MCSVLVFFVQINFSTPVKESAAELLPNSIQLLPKFVIGPIFNTRRQWEEKATCSRFSRRSDFSATPTSSDLIDSRLLKTKVL